MTTILPTLDAITDQYDALLCDVWGVVHNGREIYPAAAAALQRARKRGQIVILLTNVPKPRGPIPAQLDRLGFPRDAYDAIVTSGDAIRAELGARAPGPFYKIGPDYDRVLWEGLGLSESALSEASFFAISGLFNDDDTPEMYADTLRDARARDLDLLCANPDIVVQFGDRLIWCAGAVARDYAKLGGKVIMAGKPYAPIYELAYRELEQIAGRAIPKSRILAIGDGLGTDVLGANNQDLDCLFIAAGTHGEKLWKNGVVDTNKVEAALTEADVYARYVMTGLA